MIIPCPRISDPSVVVQIEHEDLGIVLAAVDGGKTKAAYTSIFRVDGEEIVSTFDVVAKMFNPAHARYTQDVANLAARDIDLPAGMATIA